MTKAIRIENADTSDHNVVVHIEEQHQDGTWHRVSSEKLNYPTAMLNKYVHSTQRLVIEEFSEQ